MSNLKISNWFKLPVYCSQIVDGTEVVGSSDSIAIDGCVVLTDHHVEKVEIAINSYDSNQELIAKQAKRIKGQLKGLEVAGKVIENLECVESKLQADNELLRELLTEVMHDECGAEQHLGETTCDRITLALAATAKG